METRRLRDNDRHEIQARRVRRDRAPDRDRRGIFGLELNRTKCAQTERSEFTVKRREYKYVYIAVVDAAVYRDYESPPPPPPLLLIAIFMCTIHCHCSSCFIVVYNFLCTGLD